MATDPVKKAILDFIAGHKKFGPWRYRLDQLKKLAEDLEKEAKHPNRALTTKDRDDLRKKIRTWQKDNPKEFHGRGGRPLLNAFDEALGLWITKDLLTVIDEFKEYYTSFKDGVNLKGLSFDYFNKNFEDFKRKYLGACDADRKLSVLAELEEALYHWIRENRNDAKKCNGRPVNTEELEKGTKPDAITKVKGPVGPIERFCYRVTDKLRKDATSCTKFFVYNCGTDHTRDEKNLIFHWLYEATQAGGGQRRHVNNGPGHEGDIRGKGGGYGLAHRARATVRLIELLEPAEVFLVGHSRGAVLSNIIANWAKNRLKKAPKKVYIFGIDPVSMSVSGTTIAEDRSKLPDNVVDHVVMLMENVVHAFYPLTLATVDKKPGCAEPYVGQKHRTANGTRVITMPGTHGSATQVWEYDGNPIGKITKHIVLQWLDDHSCALVITPETEDTLFEEFFEINKLYPVTYWEGSRVRPIPNFDTKKDFTDTKAKDKWLGEVEAKAKKRFFGRRKKGEGWNLALKKSIARDYKAQKFEEIEKPDEFFHRTFDDATDNPDKTVTEWINPKIITQWTKHPLIVNHYHERLFAGKYPAIHKKLCEKMRIDVETRRRKLGLMPNVVDTYKTECSTFPHKNLLRDAGLVEPPAKKP